MSKNGNGEGVVYKIDDAVRHLSPPPHDLRAQAAKIVAWVETEAVETNGKKSLPRMRIDEFSRMVGQWWFDAKFACKPAYGSPEAVALDMLEQATGWGLREVQFLIGAMQNNPPDTLAGIPSLRLTDLDWQPDKLEQIVSPFRYLVKRSQPDTAPPFVPQATRQPADIHDLAMIDEWFAAFKAICVVDERPLSTQRELQIAADVRRLADASRKLAGIADRHGIDPVALWNVASGNGFTKTEDMDRAHAIANQLKLRLTSDQTRQSRPTPYSGEQILAPQALPPSNPYQFLDEAKRAADACLQNLRRALSERDKMDSLAETVRLLFEANMPYYDELQSCWLRAEWLLSPVAAHHKSTWQDCLGGCLIPPPATAVEDVLDACERLRMTIQGCGERSGQPSDVVHQHFEKVRDALEPYAKFDVETLSTAVAREILAAKNRLAGVPSENSGAKAERIILDEQDVLADGPRDPFSLCWKKKIYKIGSKRKRQVWDLLEFFWERESATFAELTGDGKPWSTAVSDGARRSAVNRFNLELRRVPDFTWTLHVSKTKVYKEKAVSRNPLAVTDT